MVINLLDRRAVQAGRPAGGAQMSAAAPCESRRARPSPRDCRARPASGRRLARACAATASAWRRCRSCSLFLVLVAAGASSAWSPPTGSARRRCPTRRRTFLGPRGRQAGDRSAAAGAERPAGRHLGDVDPLAPRYAEWAERAAKVQDRRGAEGADAAVRRRPDRPRRARQGDQGRADLDLRRRRRGPAGHADRHAARRARPASSAARSDDLLEWLYNVFTVDPVHPADLRVRGGAVGPSASARDRA